MNKRLVVYLATCRPSGRSYCGASMPANLALHIACDLGVDRMTVTNAIKRYAAKVAP